MPAAIIPSMSGPQFAARLADLFPRGWCSDDAKQSGNVYALLLSVGNELSALQGQLQYALAAQRIQTETFPELDLASIDFLGDLLPRPSGLSDADYAAAIIAALFRPAATRSALQNAVAALTGIVPRMIEPWNVNDTGAWGAVSYWNVDSFANPARWGNGGLRYQGFIETAPAAIPAIGPGNPIQCWGDSAYWNQPGYFFGIIQPVARDAIDNVLERLHAYGTEIWVKIIGGSAGGSTAPSVVTGLAAQAAGTDRILVSWIAPGIGTPPLVFYVYYRQSGTSGFAVGAVVSSTTATVLNLAPGVAYDFQVIATNPAGSSTSAITSASTSKVPPAPASGLQATLVQANAITVIWTPPVTGTPPFSYSVNYRITGTTTWQTLPVGLGTTGVTLVNLVPSTSYDIEVLSSNL